jgi:hypothetical protein
MKKYKKFVKDKKKDKKTSDVHEPTTINDHRGGNNSDQSGENVSSTGASAVSSDV